MPTEAQIAKMIETLKVLQVQGVAKAIQTIKDATRDPVYNEPFSISIVKRLCKAGMDELSAWRTAGEILNILEEANTNVL